MGGELKMNMKEFKKRLNDNRGRNLKGEKVKDNNDFMIIDLGKNFAKIKSNLSLNKSEVKMMLEDLNLSNIGKNSVIRVSEVCDVCYDIKCISVKENEILFVTC